MEEDARLGRLGDAHAPCDGTLTSPCRSDRPFKKSRNRCSTGSVRGLRRFASVSLTRAQPCSSMSMSTAASSAAAAGTAEIARPHRQSLGRSWLCMPTRRRRALPLSMPANAAAVAMGVDNLQRQHLAAI